MNADPTKSVDTTKPNGFNKWLGRIFSILLILIALTLVVIGVTSNNTDTVTSAPLQGGGLVLE